MFVIIAMKSAADKAETSRLVNLLGSLLGWLSCVVVRFILIVEMKNNLLCAVRYPTTLNDRAGDAQVK